jgi:DNA-directed RNA polymerase beta' subunit
MVIPEKKKELIGQAQDDLQRVVDQYQEGLITDGERYNKVVDIWAGDSDKVTEEKMAVNGKSWVTHPETKLQVQEPSFNSIYIMADSGARGSTQQMRQLAAMRSSATTRMQSAGHAAAQSEQPTHFSSPFACRWSRWRPRKRGYTGRLNSGYCCVIGCLKMCLNVTPKPFSVPNG